MSTQPMPAPDLFFETASFRTASQNGQAESNASTSARHCGHFLRSSIAAKLPGQACLTDADVGEAIGTAHVMLAC